MNKEYFILFLPDILLMALLISLGIFLIGWKVALGMFLLLWAWRWQESIREEIILIEKLAEPNKQKEDS